MFKWIKTKLSAVASTFRNTGLANPARWFTEVVTLKSDAGVNVNAAAAIGYAPVWYAVNKIAGHVGQLPLSVHRRLERGSEMAKDHPAYVLVKTRPNRYQTAIQFKEQMMSHALLWGNARAAIIRDGNRVVELLPLPPDRTQTCMVDGTKWHLLDLDKDDPIVARGGTRAGMQHGGKYKIPDQDCLHIPGLGFDGIAGISLIQVAKNVLGLGMASEKAANKAFANGSRPDVVLEAPDGVLNDDKDAKEFIDSWNSFHMGLDNAGRAGLLRDGIKATTLSMSAQDAQWIEQRRFQRQETALLFLLEQILGDDSSVSYNSLEQKNLAYLSNCLMRWLVKWEQECDEKLRSSRERDRDTHFFKFNVSALLRADSKTQMDTISGYIATRVYSPNEGRALLDLNPYEGGDTYENPAITPGSPGDEEESVMPEDANRRAVLAQLNHMIGVEAKRVLGAAGNKRNYVGWIDKFYEEWTETLGNTCDNLGNRKAAEAHCEQSKEALLEVAGTVTPDGLADAVAELVETWPDRAEALAGQILNKEVECLT